MSHRARKRFGQHFLTAPDVIERIVSTIGPQPEDVIVEIGPGRAAITDPLSRLAGSVHGVEFDRDLAAMLRNRFAACGNVMIHEADALRFDFSSVGDALRIVGNLPYNISTPLLFRLLEFEDCIVDMHFMLQKEVVGRICAAPGTKHFGRLTVMLGCRMESVPLFDVPPDAFSPPPRIMSSVVRMRPLPADHFGLEQPRALEQLVKLAFSRRRKTLRNALQGMAGPAEIAAVGLDAASRPEQVPIEGWVALANHVA